MRLANAPKTRVAGVERYPATAGRALRTLEVQKPHAADRGVHVPVSITAGGNAFQGEVVLCREGDRWRVHSAPIEWLQRLAP